MSQFLYLPEFIEQVSQIVFLAYFTVQGVFTTIKRKMSQNSYLREFCEQVSHVVFLVDLTVLRFLQLYEEKCPKTYISLSSLNKYHKSCF